MSNDTRKDLPPASSPGFLEKTRETLSTYLGLRGDKLDRGITLRDLVDSGIVKLRPGFLNSGGPRPVYGIGPALDALTDVDLTPPPTPTGFAVSAGITTVFISHDGPSYSQGHGHARTEVYGATWVSGPLPVFSNAVKITEFSGSIFSYSTNPATTWHLWIKWVSVDGVASTVPAGGTNGAQVKTGQDVALLLEALTGEIEAGQLHTDLSTRINLIDSPAATAGSVNARLAAIELTRANDTQAESEARVARAATEVLARNEAIATAALGQSNALKSEADQRVLAQTVEARERMAISRSSAETMLQGALATHAARLDASDAVAIARQELTENFKAGDFAEATSRQLLAAKLDTDVSNALAAVVTESTARATAIGAEATQRNLLAAQFRGAYTGTDPAQLTEGLLYQERTTRVAQGNALAQQITLLSAGAGEQFDWASIWYFDATAEGWTGNGTPTVAAGFLRPADASDPYVISPDALALDGAKYIQMRLRVRKYGNPTWAGQLRWATPALNTFNETNVAALTVPTFDANGIGLVTVTPGWTGTITRVRLDLSVDQTDADYYTIDWVAVGRPSPGASSAQLSTIETTLTNSIGSVAGRAAALEAKVGDNASGLVKTVATIVDTYSSTATANAATADAQRTLLANFGPSKVFREAGTAVLSGDDTGGPAQVANFTAITLKDGTTGYLPKIALGNVWYNTANGNKPHSWDGGFWRYTPDVSATATQAYLNSLESALATPTTAVVEAVRAMEASVLDPVTGAPITLATLNTAQKTTAGLIDAGVSDVRALRAQSKSISETTLQAILNGEAARDAFTGSLALAREEITSHIVDGLSAEAAKRLTLAAVVGTNAAALTLEQTTRADQFSAVTTSVETLTSTVEDNAATLVNNYSTKADADSATTSAQQMLITHYGPSAIFRGGTAPVQANTPITLANGTIIQKPSLKSGDLWFDTSDGAKPHQWSGSAWVYSPDVSAAANTAYLDSLESALVNATSATVTAWRNLVAEAKDPITGLAATRADLQIEQTTRATATESSAKDARTLRSQSRELSDVMLQAILNGEAAKDAFIGSLALAREEITTHIVDGLSAEAEKRLLLTAVVGANGTALTQEQTTRANQIEAVAQDITRLNSTVEGNQAALVNDYYTKSNTDGAIAQAGTYLRAYSNLGAASFRQAAAPTIRGVDPQTGADVALRVGDDWLDTDDSKPYQWNGSAWVAASDGAIATVDARVSDVESTKIGYCLLGGSASDHTTRGTCEAAGGTWNVGLPLATAVKQVSISDGDSSVALEQRFTTQKQVNGDLTGQYFVKADSNGAVSGFGLSTTIKSDTGATSSEFAVRTDRFYAAAPVDYSQEDTPAGTDDKRWYKPSTKETFVYASGAWSLNSAFRVPAFVVQSTPTTAANGTEVPAGVYMPTAFIKNATITAAQIGSVKADSIQAGVLQAVISQTGALFNGVNAYTFTTNAATGVVTATATGQTPGTSGFGTGYYLGSLSGAPTFFVGSPANHMYWNGSALTVKGTVYAVAGWIGGNTIDATGVESPGYVAGSTGWRLDTSGLLRAFSNSGSRVLDLAATGSASVLKIGSTLDVRADGTATFCDNGAAQRLVITSNKIEVWSGGVRRVVLGDLS